MVATITICVFFNKTAPAIKEKGKKYMYPGVQKFYIFSYFCPPPPPIRKMDMTPLTFTLHWRIGYYTQRFWYITAPPIKQKKGKKYFTLVCNSKKLIVACHWNGYDFDFWDHNIGIGNL